MTHTEVRTGIPLENKVHALFDFTGIGWPPQVGLRPIDCHNGPAHCRIRQRDERFIHPRRPLQFPQFSRLTGQGTFTADDVTGVISAFEWAAIPSYSFSSLTLADFSFGSATFDAGVLTGLSVDATDGFTRLVLSVGDGNGGPIAELSTDLFFAMGSYAIFDAETGTQILGVSASPMPEPSAAVLYGAGLLIANGTMRRRRQS